MDADLTQSLEWKAEWRCWQTGIELHYLGTTLLRIKEVGNRVGVSPFDYRALRLACFKILLGHGLIESFEN